MTIIQPNEAAEMLARYSADISHECPVTHCRARKGEPCRGVPPSMVHESRRLQRLKREGLIR